MFILNNKKTYKVSSIRGGTSEKGSYTFIGIEDELHKGQKYPDRLKINVWGEDLSSKIKVDTYVSINKCNELGLVYTKDKNDPNKGYTNLTISCNANDVVTGEPPVKQNKENEFNITPDDLPF